MLGGLGICGRPFCCASFLDEFQPVSIKMAKTQSLSLNPTKISGTCGRLMCCLKYEQEAYEDLIRTSPKAESFVDTPDGRGTVTAVNLMHQTVSVRMEQDEDEVHGYRMDEIFVLRNGKAKKNDPPIPPDLAPISGRKDGELLRERRPFLDHRLTLDPEERETLTEREEPKESEAPAAEQSRENGRRSRRERGGKPEQAERSEQADKPAPETASAEKPAQEKKASESGKKKRNRRGKKPGAQGEKPQRPEQPERIEKAEGSAGQQPSRQQRRRQQQGKPEAKLPQAEQPKRPVPEKAGQAEQPAPKPEGKKNNKRRYYHNRKPKG